MLPLLLQGGIEAYAGPDKAVAPCGAQVQGIHALRQHLPLHAVGAVRKGKLSQSLPL